MVKSTMVLVNKKEGLLCAYLDNNDYLMSTNNLDNPSEFEDFVEEDLDVSDLDINEFDFDYDEDYEEYEEDFDVF